MSYVLCNFCVQSFYMCRKSTNFVWIFSTTGERGGIEHCEAPSKNKKMMKKRIHIKVIAWLLLMLVQAVPQPLHARHSVTAAEPMEVQDDVIKAPTTDGAMQGHIMDDLGDPLPGARVGVKGNAELQTVTDINGNFSLKNVPLGSNITVSYMGMQPIHMKWKGKELRLMMHPNDALMNEVVVNGYFQKTKANFTGVAKSYDAEQLQAANPVNLLSALSIVDPSFKMTENNLAGSDPNTIPEFTVRGQASLPDDTQLRSSFQGSPNMPTFIMDGFEVSAEKVFDMDVNRIESLTILKDAAATAVYGSRASNGVIVITTKQPRDGRLRATYNVDLSFNMPDLSDYHLLDATQKLELERAAGYFAPLGNASQTEARIEDYNFRRSLVARGYNTYWLNKPLHTAVGHKHSVSIEGGESSIRYALDLSYNSTPGVMKESGRGDLGVGATLLYRWKNLTFRENLTYDNVTSDQSPYGDFSTYARMNPYYNYQDAHGKYLMVLEAANDVTGRQAVFNPLYNTTLHTINATSYSQFINNFGVDWYITPDLRMKGDFAIRHKKNEATQFKPGTHTDFANYGDNDFYRRGSYRQTEGKEFALNGNITLSWFKQYGKHGWNANAGWNIQQETGDAYTIRAEGFQDENLDHLSFALQYAEGDRPSGEDYISRLVGFLTNFGYSYDNRYVLDLSARADGSSKFGSQHRWAPFWSVGAGWNLHKEAWAKTWKNTVDELKLKLSYGMTGSQAFSPYQSMVMYEYLSGQRYRNGIGAVMEGLGNPYLRWQETHQLNVGADMQFLKNRIALAANWYRKTSSGLLTDVTLPPSLGYTTYRENLGEVENSGFEWDVRFTLFKQKDSYVNLSLSGVYNRNRLLKISNSLKAWNDAQDATLSATPKVKFVEGESINTIWGVRSLGINPANGREIFVKRDGTLTDVYDVADQVPVGCSDAKQEGNIGIDAGWNGLRLNLYLRYRLGGQQYNQTLVDRVENADKRYNCDERVLDARWQEPGDVTFFKDVSDNTLTRPTSRFVQRYNFLQLSTISLSYDMPRKLIQRWRMETLRFTFSANDLFYLSSIKQERGLSYPFARALRLSMRLTF